MRHLISCKAAAEYLGLKFSTLEIWRSNGKNLPFYKIGGCVRYATEDLDAYLYHAVMKPKPLTPEWLTTEQARIYLGGIAHATLRDWRCRNINLTFYKQGNLVRYLNLNLEEFLDRHRYTKTVLPDAPYVKRRKP
jgi:excisionase family DNA binding protein